MGLTDRLKALVSRADPALSFDEWVSWFSYQQNIYTSTGLTTTMPGNKEEEISEAGYFASVYKRNGIIFACSLARSLLFSEARFQFQELVKGRPGDLFGTPDLALLETPGPNQSTRDLLAGMIQDVDIFGNWFGVRRAFTIQRLDPRWVTIIMGSERDPEVTADDIDAKVIGYIYHPGGRYSGRDPEFLVPEVVAHWNGGIKDPQARYRGMSWITSVGRETMADNAATSHKLAYFENAATPNMVVSLDKDVSIQAYKDYVATFKDNEPKGFDAYKTLYLGGGAAITSVGSDMQQMDFKVTQGAGETRICAAARVPPIIVGVSEGLSAATYSNYGMARRAFADMTLRPLWGGAAAVLSTIITVPPGSRLWYDDRDIPFLQEDVKDAAEILSTNAAAIRTLSDAGAEWDAVIDAVTANDLGRLKGRHTGLYSVQLQPPMPEGPPTQLPTEKPVPKQIEAPRAEPPVLNIYNDFPEGFVRAGDVTVNTPEQPAPVVNVTLPEQPASVTNVTVPERSVTVEAPEVTVNVPKQDPPVVNIAEGAIRATVEPAEVNVYVPDVEPPNVTVNLPQPKPVTKTVKRNDAGQITEVTEE